MSSPAHRKRSFYISEELLKEMTFEAERQDRSVSWMIQQAWKIARHDIKKLPSVTDVFDSRSPVPSSALQL